MFRLRKWLCVLLSLALLLPLCSAAALEEEIDEGWSKKSVRYERTPEPITVVPWEEIEDPLPTTHHYLLLCLDRWADKVVPRPEGIDVPHYGNGARKDDYGYTDGIVIVTLDTRSKRVMLTSLSRECLVKKPNNGTGRINRIYNDYGPEALCRTISEHLNIKIEKYIIFNFSQIQAIVDFLGGVDVALDRTEISKLRFWRVPEGTAFDPDGVDLQSGRPSSHGEGVYHLQGFAAVIYMRIRKASGHGDFMRTQRVRNVLSNLADKCRNITLDDAYALANCVLDNSTMTNMNLAEMREAAEYAFELRGCTIEELQLPTENAYRPILYLRMQTEEVNWAICRRAMKDYLQNSFLVIDEEDEE